MITENEGAITAAANELMEVEEFNDMVDEMERDINGPSYFTEDDGLGFSRVVRDARGNAAMLTPEMLEQRVNLNEMWNENCQRIEENRPGGQIWGTVRGAESVPDTYCTLEFVSIGEKFGLAKCDYGSVYVPKSAINHIKNVLSGKIEVGQMFDAWISQPGHQSRYTWRIEQSIGVTEVY